jgi:hypothetical protein
VTYIIAEPCIDIKDLSCVDVCPSTASTSSSASSIIDPRSASTAAPASRSARSRRSSPRTRFPTKWEPFVKINYAYGDGADVINKLTDEYATEHNVQNEPLE